MHQMRVVRDARDPGPPQFEEAMPQPRARGPQFRELIHQPQAPRPLPNPPAPQPRVNRAPAPQPRVNRASAPRRQRPVVTSLTEEQQMMRSMGLPYMFSEHPLEEMEDGELPDSPVKPLVYQNSAPLPDRGGGGRNGFVPTQEHRGNIPDQGRQVFRQLEEGVQAVPVNNRPVAASSSRRKFDGFDFADDEVMEEDSFVDFDKMMGDKESSSEEENQTQETQGGCACCCILCKSTDCA